MLIGGEGRDPLEYEVDDASSTLTLNLLVSLNMSMKFLSYWS